VTLVEFYRSLDDQDQLEEFCRVLVNRIREFLQFYKDIIVYSDDFSQSIIDDSSNFKLIQRVFDDDEEKEKLQSSNSTNELIPIRDNLNYVSFEKYEEICPFSCAYCFSGLNTYQLECGRVLCKSCYNSNPCCENTCWICRKHGSFLLRECKKNVCDSCYSISGCCEKMCSKCFIHQDFLYQQSGKLICETCHHLHDSNQIYCLCGSSKNLKEYDGSFKCASCLEKIKSTRLENIDIEIIGENQHNYSSSLEFIKKNKDSDTSSIEDLDEKVSHRCGNRFYSLDSKLSEDTCSLCYNKGILKFCSLNHGVCKKCSLKACSMCKIHPECQACNLTIRCINCTKFYCQKCKDLSIHIEKCSSKCEKCGINPSNSRKKCGHILCSHCSYPSGNLCSI
jgi:hypothetical protein